MATKTQIDLSKIILMPHVSEKSVMLGENNKQQTFKVIKDASKNDIKKGERINVSKIKFLRPKGIFNPVNLNSLIPKFRYLIRTLSI